MCVCVCVCVCVYAHLVSLVSLDVCGCVCACVCEERVLKSVFMVMRWCVCQQQMICVRVLAELSHGALLFCFDSSVFNGQPRTSFEYRHPACLPLSLFWTSESRAPLGFLFGGI